MFLINRNNNVFLTDNIKEVKQHVRELLNKQKQKEIDNLTITYNDATFQADEESQNRVIRAVAVMGDNNTIDWLDIDNNVHTFTKEDLFKAFAQVKDKMTSIVVKYAELKKQLAELQTMEEIRDFVNKNKLEINFIKE